jgi:hypothetical protein
MLQVVSRSQVKPRAVKAHQQVLDVRCCSCKPGYLRGQCTSDRYHVVQLLWVLHSVTSLQRYALGELNPCSSQYQLAAGDTTTATNIQEAGHHQRTSASRRRSSTPPPPPPSSSRLRPQGRLTPECTQLRLRFSKARSCLVTDGLHLWQESGISTPCHNPGLAEREESGHKPVHPHACLAPSQMLAYTHTQHLAVPHNMRLTWCGCHPLLTLRDAACSTTVSCALCSSSSCCRSAASRAACTSAAQLAAAAEAWAASVAAWAAAADAFCSDSALQQQWQ